MKSHLFQFILIIITATLFGGALFVSPVFAQGNNTTVGVLELISTYESISVYANFVGDDNRNSSVFVEYRKVGAPTWIRGMDLAKYASRGQWRGSILLVNPETQYEVRVTFADPDGVVGSPVTNSVSTWIETANIPSNGKDIFVATSGDDITGDGSEANPFLTIQKGVIAVPLCLQD